MAHNLEMNSNGDVAFALRGEPAWHNLANATFGAEDDVTTQQMLDSALLSGWDVRLEPITYPEGYLVNKPEFMVVRNHPMQNGQAHVLGTVGARYYPYQNEQLFAFGDNLLDGGGFWESAGSIKNGSTVFGSLKLGKSIVLDPQGIADTTENYLLVTTSHDGSTAIQAMTTPVRVVCQNTLNFALRGAKQSYKVRHTATAGDRVEEARRALGISFAYIDTFEAEAQALFATAITNKTFGDIVEALYPTPDVESAKASLTKHETKIDLIWDLYNGETQKGIRDTAWGAVNALTERLDYYRNGRSTNGTDPVANQATSASGFDVQTNAEKARILKAVKELAGV